MRILTLGVGVVALTGAIAIGDAHACGGAMIEDSGTMRLREIKRIRAAEALLIAGRLEDAARGMTHISRDRGRRVLARVIARSDGKLGGHDLRWATDVLFEIAQRTDDPRALTDLGEVLSRQPEHFVRARDVLEDLAGRDLITSAEGWAALAGLRSPIGRDHALRRCEAMANDASICRA
jgi:hypothetical protein